MSQDQEKKKGSKLWIGKQQVVKTQYGDMYKILMDNPKSVKEDGTPDQYYKGSLVFYTPDGQGYLVKQMMMQIPKDGMSQANASKGFTCHITLDLENEYQVEILK